MLDEDALAEQLQREPRRALDQALVPLQERADEAPVVLGEVGRQRALDPLEDRAPLGGGADEDESVVRDADERGGEDGEQRLVVVAVLQQPQVGEQVDDLLLAEVAAAGHPDRRQVDSPQLLLEPLGVRPGREQQDDLAGRRGAGVDELAHAARDVPRLGAPPVEARVGVRRLVGDEQLERRPEHRVAVAGGRHERLEALAELVGEQLVDRGEHLGPRPVVRGSAAGPAVPPRACRGTRPRRRAGSRRSTGTRRRRRTAPSRGRRRGGRSGRSGGGSCPGTRRP